MQQAGKASPSSPKVWRLAFSAMAISAALERWGAPSREMEVRRRHPPIRACKERVCDVPTTRHRRWTQVTYANLLRHICRTAWACHRSQPLWANDSQLRCRWNRSRSSGSRSTERKFMGTWESLSWGSFIYPTLFQHSIKWNRTSGKKWCIPCWGALLWSAHMVKVGGAGALV